MKDSLKHLPEHKQQEIAKLVESIKKFATVEMIILFGSHSRPPSKEGVNSWVSHKYVRENAVFEYSSDFDILIVVRSKKMEEDFGVWDQVEADAYKNGVRTWISLLIDNIHYVNEQLELGRYFYSDIKKEGILLYDSGRYALAEAKDLSEDKQRSLAKKDFEHWYESAKFFYDDFKGNLDKGRYNMSVFNLHQAAERFLVAFLLVGTGYRPKTHDLKNLLDFAQQLDSDIWKIFLAGIDLPEERRLFELLRKAYVDARYESSYKITFAELELLGTLVSNLSDYVFEFCSSRI